MPSVVFALLSFEGPDGYARAGGLGSRETELSETLASLGYETHLVFIGDPDLPGHEVRCGGHLHLHRWCQWISRFHPGGVYDGEEGKYRDWNRSLPPWLATNVIAPAVAAGNAVVVLAEEWHTAESVVALRRIVDAAAWHGRVELRWNANNLFGSDRVDWDSLASAATVTTVSCYMRTLLAERRVEASVVPNGIADAWLTPGEPVGRGFMERLRQERLVLTKVARWDPDKNWAGAVTATATLKRLGLRPLLLARGGMEPLGADFMTHARAHGIEVRHVNWYKNEVWAPLDAIRTELPADVIVLDHPLDPGQSKILFAGSHAVLANSGREPFGLVGLETMAAGGVAIVGCTGEDYATPGHDAYRVQSRDPWEVVHTVARLLDAPAEAAALRRAARSTARHFTWREVLRRALLPSLTVGNGRHGQEPAAEALDGSGTSV